MNEICESKENFKIILLNIAYGKNSANILHPPTC